MNEALKYANFDFSLKDLKWEDGRELYQWWDNARGSKEFPSRSDFNPLKFQKILPTIMLMDVDEDPLTFHMRLVGTEVCTIMDQDPTGKPITFLRGGDALHDRFTQLIEKRKPYFALDVPLIWANKDHRFYNVLMLPLSSDGEKIDKLLTHLDFF